MRDDFNMLKHPGRFVNQLMDTAMAEHKPDTLGKLYATLQLKAYRLLAHNHRLWKTGAHSDFVVKVGGKSFDVHKAM